MIALGLTGSIGMGKSTVAAMFADEGVPVFDADATVRRLQRPRGRLLPAIEARFPGSTGRRGVDRDALGALVFGNEMAIRALEAIVHPAVAEERALFRTTHRGAPLLLFDVPLLYETGGDSAMDVVAVVTAAPSVQRQRVLARPGMTPAKLHAILARQLPDAEKQARARFVIRTDVPLNHTRDAVRDVIACLVGKAAR
ncbi:MULTISPECIES: dephospho-CoA kinase [unclassified Sphingomonas]|uniref:dephospho-CoA kinase n=1 Tax=unclassified Sphingomonas TaxID=196159 RepID=UPI001F59599B|nr:MULTISPECIES: dephospho-CoA kinase [unclassified Sphingomonas]